MIVVTGANGQLGRAVVAALQDRIGNDFRVSVRQPGAAIALAQQGIGVRQGDYDDIDSMVRAFAGSQKLLLISGDAPVEIRIQQHRNAIEAAKQAGVEQVVYTSFLDVETDSPFTFTPIHRDTEVYLAHSGLNYTLLRHSIYAEVNLMFLPGALATGRFSFPAGNGAVSFISRDDLARVIATILTTSGHEGQTYELTGTTAYNLTEVTSALSAAVGQPLVYDDCTPEVFAANLQGAGLPEFLVEAMVSMAQAIKENCYASVSNSVAELTGTPPEDGLAFLQRSLATSPLVVAS